MISFDVFDAMRGSFADADIFASRLLAG